MRSIWNGSIGFGLVNIPVRLYSAVQDSGLDLDMLDDKDHSRIKYQRINEDTRREVPFDRIVKGYDLDGKYVILDDSDFEAASPKKSKIIELENFVDLDEVNPIYYETSYYAEPAEQGKKPYALLLQALEKSKKAGVARFVLRQKENLCIIHPLQKVLVVSRIRFAEEIRDTKNIKSPKEIKISKKELDIGLSLIDQYSSKFDVAAFHDEYTKELMKIIRAKAKGKVAKVKKLKPVKTSGDNLYDQLMESLKTKKKAG